MGAPAANQHDQIHNQVSGSTRLHISPFDPSLFSSLIHPSLRPQASNISFHSIQTFPERNYGFVDLPVLEARRLQDKFHGSILRGVKLRVEVARPPQIVIGAPNNQEAEKKDIVGTGKKLNPISRPGDDQVIRGLLLSNNRRIGRGWTEPRHPTHQSLKERERRGPKFFDRATAQCLFRTRLPLNVLSNLRPTSKSVVKMGKRRVRQASDQDVVVHEFAATTKFSSFLRDETVKPAKKPVSHYVDGEGWVDEDGTVVEPVKSASHRRRNPPAAQENTPAKEDHRKEIQTNEQQTSPGDEDANPKTPEPVPVRERFPKSSRKLKRRATASPAKDSEAESRHTSAPRVGPPLSITIPTETTPTETTQPPVHPLESIFKKPGKRQNASDMPIEDNEAPFSFFEPNIPDETVMPALQVPPTPFTQQDFRIRGIRSAAPTPDTAAPGKRFSFDWRQNDEEEDDDDDDEDEDEDEADEQNGEDVMRGIEETEKVIFGDRENEDLGAREEVGENGDASTSKGFEDQFWEQRAHTNRVWRRRRRETGKVRRRMENKRFVRRGQQ
ncbi:MAG: hypothetical protein M1823_000231 [Watsoniomyces obsoletus]|nr:MAG: hypothetical protein M1823_000231 [Watsoniomyces obsoletus]